MSDIGRTVRTLLASVVKAALMGDDRASLLWREEAVRALDTVRAQAGAAAALTFDGLWVLAVREAEAPEYADQEGRVSFGLPVQCPFTLPDLLAPGFDVDAAVERVRKSAATG